MPINSKIKSWNLCSVNTHQGDADLARLKEIMVERLGYFLRLSELLM